MIKSYKNLDKIDRSLIDSADKIVKNGYDPYSKFYVGAALLAESGAVYTGANINTCAYASICAERIAIGNAVTNGEYLFKKIAVIAKSDFNEVNVLSGPCGICRQMLWEFAELSKGDIEILVADSSKDKVLVTTIKNLHQYGFGPRLCEGDFQKYIRNGNSHKHSKRQTVKS
ncbi:MAG: cytidine deaminase [Candidatus Micrarchaeota archaeon]|nr:cytidine deaminase [Candidatus Micrarchaeota archaeon]